MGPEDGISECEAECSSYKRCSLEAKESESVTASVGADIMMRNVHKECIWKQRHQFGHRRKRKFVTEILRLKTRYTEAELLELKYVILVTQRSLQWAKRQNHTNFPIFL